jgi:hypothetical protein
MATRPRWPPSTEPLDKTKNLNSYNALSAGDQKKPPKRVPMIVQKGVELPLRLFIRPARAVLGKP